MILWGKWCQYSHFSFFFSRKGTERLSNVQKITQLKSCKVSVWSKAKGLQTLHPLSILFVSLEEGPPGQDCGSETSLWTIFRPSSTDFSLLFILFHFFNITLLDKILEIFLNHRQRFHCTPHSTLLQMYLKIHDWGSVRKSSNTVKHHSLVEHTLRITVFVLGKNVTNNQFSRHPKASGHPSFQFSVTRLTVLMSYWLGKKVIWSCKRHWEEYLEIPHCQLSNSFQSRRYCFLKS